MSVNWGSIAPFHIFTKSRTITRLTLFVRDMQAVAILLLKRGQLWKLLQVLQSHALCMERHRGLYVSYMASILLLTHVNTAPLAGAQTSQCHWGNGCACVSYKTNTNWTTACVPNVLMFTWTCRVQPQLVSTEQRCFWTSTLYHKCLIQCSCFMLYLPLLNYRFPLAWKHAPTFRRHVTLSTSS
jgi:hypothetical protein